MQSDILDYVVGVTGAGIGQLPETGGLVVQLAPSPVGVAYLDGASSDNSSLLFLCKNSNQRAALTQLESVCETLVQTQSHECGAYSWWVATMPNYVGKEGDYWIYSCIIGLKYYKEVT